MTETDACSLMEVSAGLIWRGGCILAALRPDGRALAGYWELPGGKLQPGESADDALRRELAEELGINVSACQFVQSLDHSPGPGRVVRLHFFHVTEFSGAPKPLENQILRWVTPAQALQMNFLPADICLLQKLSDACHE